MFITLYDTYVLIGIIVVITFTLKSHSVYFLYYSCNIIIIIVSVCY